jgi:hypothetical protein
MHLCVLCFELVSADLRRFCGHVFHQRCVEAWEECYGYNSCPLCQVERILVEKNMSLAWEFILFVDNKSPEILQTFFKEDENAAGVLFDLLVGYVSPSEILSLRSFSHCVFLSLIAHVQRSSPILVLEFVSLFHPLGNFKCDPEELLSLCTLARMTKRTRDSNC